MDAKVIQAGRFDQKTSAAEQRRILEELVMKDAVCMVLRTRSYNSDSESLVFHRQ